MLEKMSEKFWQSIDIKVKNLSSVLKFLPWVSEEKEEEDLAFSNNKKKRDRSMI